MGENITSAHPSLKKFASLVEDYAVDFNGRVEEALRRHGKKIYLAQLAQKRIADIAIDLYGMLCVLSRLTADIQEQGSPEAAQPQIDAAKIFFTKASRRIDSNLERMSRNIDTEIHRFAEHLFQQENYEFRLFK